MGHMHVDYRRLAAATQGARDAADLAVGKHSSNDARGVALNLLSSLSSQLFSSLEEHWPAELNAWVADVRAFASNLEDHGIDVGGTDAVVVATNRYHLNGSEAY